MSRRRRRTARGWSGPAGQFAHLAEDGGVGGLVAEGQLHARQQLFLAVGAGGVLHLALFVGQLGVEGIFQLKVFLFVAMVKVSGEGKRVRTETGVDCGGAMNSCLILIAD